ncbi:ABC transporter substrate-binding protein [Actinomycetospora sp. TBRC 11914]|uniref:ABC transporter substrate-binding protein n=1 Tax=Actinomycetospora sp. TBRC 11914 TaxID=2729387 RepID=UPI00145CF5E2|nr:ABC transporter substrate-binding protein [Actinomycetospora sp. TBRC 11914]NMO92233.1 ABC transporter substrate-binding protein [Actinomycetospora sp. TBRC 11914]
MQTTTVAAERTVARPPHEVFALFGSAEGAGWMFDARCDDVRRGAPVSMRLPLDDLGRHDVDVLGRLSRVVPAAIIDIEHTQPWRGRLCLRFTPAGPRGTRVQVRAHVPADGVEWLLHRRGIPLPEPPDDGAVRVGVVATSSGPGAVYSLSAELMAELAVAEVNADGGVGGRPLRLVVADDATDEAQAAVEAERMARLGCRAVFVNSTSASFEAVRRVLAGRGVLVVHSVLNEGGGLSPTAVRFGERPHAQLEALVAPTMATTGARRWFLVGEGYVWSYGAHAAARRAIARAGGDVAGEALSPLGTTDFSATVEAVRRSGADLVLSTLVGADEVAFERQSEAAGLRDTTRTVSLALEESTLAHIGPRAGTGLRTALSYFQDNPVAGNDDLLCRYRAAFGEFAPAITTLSETVYEAIHRYARVLHRDPDGAAAAHARALVRRAEGAPDDVVGTRDLVRPQLYVAEAGPSGLRVLDAAAPSR